MQSPVTSSEMKMGKKLGKLTEFDIMDEDRDGEVLTVYFVTSDKGKPLSIFSFFCFQTEQNELSSFLRFLKYGKVKMIIKKSKKIIPRVTSRRSQSFLLIIGISFPSLN